jgi:hypothetical protein
MMLQAWSSDQPDREHRNGQSPERQLWCAVIGRALQDALDHAATVSSPNERQNVRDEARAWFLRNGNDFRAACESAGYDPDYLRSRIVSMFEGKGTERQLRPSGASTARGRAVCA